MAMHDEMTRYAFISHMEDYMKKLLTDPLHADTDEFLKSHGIDGPKAIHILTKRTDPNDENSAVVLVSKTIKDNGTDDNGKRLSDTFTVKCRIPRKNYTKKMRNLYINLFESNIVEKCPINERVTPPNIEDSFRKISICPGENKKTFEKAKSGDGYKFEIWFGKNGPGISDEILRIGKFLDKASKTFDIYFSDDTHFDSLDDLYYLHGTFIPTDEKYKGDVYEDLKKCIEKGDNIKLGGGNENMSKNKSKSLSEDVSTTIKEEGEGEGATSSDASGQFVQPLFGKPIKRKTIYVTQEQLDYIKKMIKEEAVMDTAFGNFGYDAPIGDGKKNKSNKFFKDANDHDSIMAKSWPKQ